MSFHVEKNVRQDQHISQIFLKQFVWILDAWQIDWPGVLRAKRIIDNLKYDDQ